MATLSPLLAVEHLHIEYGDLCVVRDVSLTLQPGEILGLIGESGCGKSTLLNAVLMMLEEPGHISSGDIRFKEKSLLELSLEDLRHLRGSAIGAVFQNPGASLNPIRKVKNQFYDTIAAHQKLPKEEMRIISLELLASLELTNPEQIMNSYPVEFSGGMNQRIAIALAMVTKPQLLICDEPTSALDVTVQGQVVGEMLKLREQYGTAMVLVTHNMGVVSYAADSLAVMYAGRVVEYGTKEEVLKYPAHPYTKALMSVIPALDGFLPRGVPGQRPALKDYTAFCDFMPRCPYAGENCQNIAPPQRNLAKEHWVCCHNPLGEE